MRRWLLPVAVACLMVVGVAALLSHDSPSEFWERRTVSVADLEAPPSAQPQQAIEVSFVGAASRVPQGSIYRFTIRLSNPTPANIPLDPCPAYSMRVDTDEQSDTDLYHLRLDCSDSPVIAAGGFEDFAMEIPFDVPCCAVVWRLWWAEGRFDWATNPVCDQGYDGAVCPDE